MCPEEGHQNDPRDGSPLLYGQVDSWGCQSREEKVLRRLESCLSVSKGSEALERDAK